MSHQVRYLLACLATFGLLVQATFGRPDSLLCLGHVHPGTCSVPAEEGVCHGEAGHHLEAEVAQEPEQQCRSNDCCCLDLQVSAELSAPLGKRACLDALRGAAVAAPPIWAASLNWLQIAPRDHACHWPAPR